MARPSHTRRAGSRAGELRRNLTISERTLWKMIRGRTTGARFRRQVPIGEYIADFAALTPRIVIELDGPDHDLRDETARTAYLARNGFHLLAYPDKDVAQIPDSVVAHIKAVVQSLQRGKHPPPWQ